ncbi:MAG: hypothetical protein D8M28_00765 [Proteobacteria bacterium]|nr:hypothetical protein [Pseudomonadota bacterium]
MKDIKDTYSFEDLAIALANCAYNKIQRPEQRVDGTIVNNVDNMCAGYFEKGTHILMHLGILTPIDRHCRRSVFNCEPTEFKEVIEKHKPGNCSYEQLVGALIWFLEFTRDEKLYEMFSSLGFCTLTDRPDLQPPSEIVWSDIRHKYDRLGYPGYFNEASKMFNGNSP